jgi:hypothetical protein
MIASREVRRIPNFAVRRVDVRYRFLSPVSCHSAIGQLKPQAEWPIFSEGRLGSGPAGIHPMRSEMAEIFWSVRLPYQFAFSVHRLCSA